jgi:HSP20 family protein
MANNLVPRRGNPLTSPATLGGGSLFDLHRQVNRLFDSLLDDRPFGTAGAAGSFAGANWPQLEIRQDDSTIHIEADLPGVKEEDIELTVEDGVLTLAGEKKSERRDDNGYSERSYGRFERRITLPANVDEDACAAQFKDGVLKVTIPTSADKQRGRRIPLGGQGATSRASTGNDNAASPGQQAAQEPSGQNPSGGAGQQG